jgi:filamentous hemagglutinin family protein
MMKTKIVLSTLVLAGVLFGESSVQSQTIPPSTRTPVADSSLGTQISGANNNFTITGGLNRGQNLFHSFQDFSVPTKGSATFLNPIGNRSIITRVTGNQFSDIDGTINTQGANFFLINPNGMVFGANTKLNVGQTFLGSTANGIDFVNAEGTGYRFGVNGNDAPLLTIDPNTLLTPARLILGGGSGEIRNSGTLKTNNPSQYIGLIGGNVSMKGGQIDAPGGRVELGGLSAAGTVTLGVQGNNLRAQFPIDVARGDVSLTNQARVNIAGGGGEDLAINARNVDILGESRIRGGIEAGLGTPESVAGDINLNATGDIAIRSGSSIDSIVRSNSKGKAGNITLTAKNAVFLVNSNIFSAIAAGGVGKGGDININASSLSFQDNAQIQTITDDASANQPAGQGSAGNVNVKVNGTVTIAGNTATSGIFSSVYTGIGNGGNITIDAGTVSLRDDAVLLASTFGQGNAGNVTVTAKDGVSLARTSGIFSTVEVGSMGKGGNIDINAGSLSLQDLGVISSSTVRESATQPGGQGDAGNINVKVTGVVDIAGTKNTFPSGIFSSVGNGTKGNGGNITVDTSSFSLRDGAQIAASTFGQGNAGTIKVNATDFVTITGKNNNSTGLTVESQSPTGTAGDIIVTSPKITLDRGGAIDATSASGKGGNIQIGGKIPTQSVSSQSVKISPSEVGLLILRRGGRISTDAGGSTQQSGDGGNIIITAPNGFIVAAPNENSDITANAFSGSGGKVSINTQQNFWISPLSRAELERLLGTTEPNLLNPFNLQTNNITAISQVNPNLNGQVTTTPPEIDPSRGLSPLPNSVTDPTNQINPNCSAKAIANNSFTSVGRGGIPATPKDPLNEQEIATNWVKLNPQDTLPSTPIATTTPALSQPYDFAQGKPIVEAQGWRREGNGDIVLVAGSSIGILPRQPQPQSGCVVR